MTDESRLKNIEFELQHHSGKLDEIAKTLSTIAVQDERLKQAETRLTLVEGEYKSLCDNNSGVIPKIMNHQASCPRGQMKWMWSVMFGLSVLMIGIGVNLLR